MTKNFLLTLLLTVVFINAYCQQVQPQKLLVRFNFLGLVDFLDNNFSTGFEYKLNNYWSAGTDAGWIFASRYINTVQAANGVIIRPFIRYYPKSKDFFIEAELHYKYVNYILEDWLGKYAFNGVPAYEEFTKFNYIKRVTGMHIRFGEQMNLTKNKKLKLEVTAGLGFRYKKEYAQEGFYFRQNFFSQTAPRSEDIKSRVTAALPVNFRLCYVVKK